MAGYFGRHSLGDHECLQLAVSTEEIAGIIVAEQSRLMRCRCGYCSAGANATITSAISSVGGLLGGLWVLLVSRIALRGRRGTLPLL